MNKKDLPVMYSSVFWCPLSYYCFFFVCFGFYCITTINILGDPGTVRRKGGMKVF